MALFTSSASPLYALLERCGPALLVTVVLAVLLPRLLWQTAQRMLFRRQARTLPLRFLREVRAGGSVAGDAALCRRLLALHLSTVEDHVTSGGLVRLSGPSLPRRTVAVCTVLTTTLAGAWGTVGLLCGLAVPAAATVVRIAAAYLETAAALRDTLRQLDALLGGDDPDRGAALLRVVLEADQGILDALAPTGARPPSAVRARRRRRPQR
ncbi:hypothetical protein JW613_00645 [Streptomyces smyrnaeus]|uniref:Uncharacterized protein n=1 Tax=Streptomyces smyrnaeus TaxID=1387713 RepID=A0ABS3XN53_9ACTN|nr:hypothetical protein [Streptomyces smyrnaeus]MBO8196827.1 hypothetical protein [Streptomyces smyrnaeus]